LGVRSFLTKNIDFDMMHNKTLAMNLVLLVLWLGLSYEMIFTSTQVTALVFCFAFTAYALYASKKYLFYYVALLLNILLVLLFIRSFLDVFQSSVALRDIFFKLMLVDLLFLLVPGFINIKALYELKFRQSSANKA